jgi:hypothetical protein
MAHEAFKETVGIVPGITFSRNGTAAPGLCGIIYIHNWKKRSKK